MHRLGQVVVTGSRIEQRLADAPVATEVITREEIEATGARTLGEYLADHPGLEIVDTPGGSGIRLQGLDPDYTLILINGERTTGRVAGTIDADRFKVENIERIEIVKGATSALYGSDAIGGVVNIILKEPEKEFEARAYASYGSYNAVDLDGNVGVRRGRGYAELSAGWQRSDPYDLDKSDIATTGSAFNDFSGTLRTGWKGSERWKIGFTADYLRRQVEGVDVTPVTVVPIFDRTETTDTLTATLKPEWTFADDSKLWLSAHYAIFRERFELDQRGDTAEDRLDETWDQIAQGSGQYSRLFFERHLVVVGVEGAYERLKTDRLNTSYADRYRFAPYLQDEWTILEEPLLVLVPGARFDFDSEYGEQLSPKATLRYDPVKRLALRVSYGLGFRAPSFKELFLQFENPSVGYSVVGNPDLQPEDSRSLNASAEYSPSSDLWFSLGAFRNDIDNLIATETVSDVPLVFSYRNVSSAVTQGIETAVETRFFGSLTLKLGYTLLHTEDKDTGLELQGRPRHRGTFSLRHRLKAWDLESTLRGAVTGPRKFYFDDDDDGAADRTAKSDVLATVEARVEKKLGEHFALFVGARNLLDARDDEFDPIRPRVVYGGLSARN
ncbi:MAG: TonB-dependent receptor [Bdellovibrionota bacterium]